MNRFHEVYRRSLEDPEVFWPEAAEGVAWTRRWDQVLDDSRSPFTRWFVGGETNTCFNVI